MMLNLFGGVMNKAELYLTSFFALIIAIALGIAYQWGPYTLLRVVAVLFFLGVTLGLLGIGFLSLYAENVKYALFSIIPAIITGYTTYLSYMWQRTMLIGLVFALIVLGVLFGIWWISEPNLSLLERLKSPDSLRDDENYRAAARKYEKNEDYESAAECYVELDQMESAAWAYEKAEDYESAAESYEEVEDEDPYHWKESYENWKKADNKLKAAESLEKYAEEEPWYWEDVAELWDEIEEDNDIDADRRAKKAWRNMIGYYEDESDEEGVFWEDVAKGYEKLGQEDDAQEAWKNFAEYCEDQADKDGSWWKHVAEAHELGNKDKAMEAKEKYEEFEESIEA